MCCPMQVRPLRSGGLRVSGARIFRKSLAFGRPRVTRPQWQNSPNVVSPAQPDEGIWQAETTAEWRPGHEGPVEPEPPGSDHRGLRRPGPVAIAAIVAGVLVVFGVGALVMPPMLSGGSSTTGAGGNATGVAPPPVAATTVDP